MRAQRVLVLGATGYVGSRLVPQLLEMGYNVRAVGRSLEKLESRPWSSHPNLKLAKANALDLESMTAAAAGCQAAFYLVHSMISAHKDYAAKDRQAAGNMIAAAAAGGLERIIYLGGLGEEGQGLSEHLKSRTEVGRILKSGPVPATILRAAMILGSGSASFEMLRYLAERLPIMITPRWVQTRVQPIAIRNVLGYLAGCLTAEETAGRVLDIGGPDVLTYAELFQIYAEEAGLAKRLIIPVPWFSPKLSSYWIGLITPVPAAIARPLAEGLRNKVVVRNDLIRSMIPQDLLTCRKTIRIALSQVRQQDVESCWSDAGALESPEWPYCEDAPYTGGTVYASGFRAVLDASTEEVWRSVMQIGGEKGWYYGKQLWRLRGWIDNLIGGVGLRRGRRDPKELRVGDSLDFWRVISLEESRRLILLAEMRLPGEGTLEITLTHAGDGRTEMKFVSRFRPRGLWGILYWYFHLPLHDIVFRGMLKGLAQSVGCGLLEGPYKIIL